MQYVIDAQHSSVEFMQKKKKKRRKEKPETKLGEN